MEGVTDAPVRRLFGKIGGFSYCVTEFLRVTNQIYRPNSFRRHAEDIWEEDSLHTQLQLLGGNAEIIAENARLAVSSGVQSIDLNFGCPAPTVNRHDGGASLLKDPCRLASIIEKTRAAVPAPIPVSAKLRLGWEDPNDILVNAEKAAQAGASWLTIHGRTKKQGYAPPAHWSYIAQVIKQTSTRIIANGDIWSLDDFKRCQDETKAFGFMVGRGAFSNPFLALQIKDHLEGRPPREAFPKTPVAWWALMHTFQDFADGHFEKPNYVTARMKQWLKFGALRGTFTHFDQIKTARTSTELLESLRVLGHAPEGEHKRVSQELGILSSDR